mgnify:CR=1 FL=1
MVVGGKIFNKRFWGKKLKGGKEKDKIASQRGKPPWNESFCEDDQRFNIHNL